MRSKSLLQIQLRHIEMTVKSKRRLPLAAACYNKNDRLVKCNVERVLFFSLKKLKKKS